MANTNQARKRVRQAAKSQAANASYRSMMRTYIKKTLKAIDSKDQDAANQALTKAQSVLDRSAKRGLIHKKKAARIVERLNAKIKALV